MKSTFNFLMGCGFTEKEAHKYTKGVMKKNTSLVNELRYRLVIKFGVKDGKELYDKLVRGVCGQVGINHIHSILYSKIGHLENWEKEYSCQWVCD